MCNTIRVAHIIVNSCRCIQLDVVHYAFGTGSWSASYLIYLQRKKEEGWGEEKVNNLRNIEKNFWREINCTKDIIKLHYDKKT